MRRIIGWIINHETNLDSSRALSRVPETPIGFVPRSDPNFYFLARKF
jgi:hypothetical protein